MSFGLDSRGRMRGMSIAKSIVYGNISIPFNKKREDGHTHQWKMYVKPYRNEDMSVYVKQVDYKLHATYTNQLRSVEKPPYEINETGWGQFQIEIKIYFIDPYERPVTLRHVLRLFPSAATKEIVDSSNRVLVAEKLEEMVFKDPTYLMYHLLSNTKQLKATPLKHTDFGNKKEKTLKMIDDGKEAVKNTINGKHNLILATETVTEFKVTKEDVQDQMTIEQVEAEEQ